MVFGESTRAGHLVDIRLEVPLSLRKKKRKRIYLVAISGQDHRSGKRAGKRGLWGNLRRLSGRLIVALIILSFLLAILFFIT